ncbi:hypothetical protein BDZ94DRAFT_1247415 [Collybia nuda]|uniref:SPT2 chromatin protein n=1 Tax=Collybia nuda TaxID=64659 RepID=A0A9P5YGK0_9AGAR|nr:hypothetical protein BDZ94DRAFT_1247415 [Collybia nuda]
MATTFQALMALSATQTKQSQSIVESQLAQRQRNEEMKRKQAELADKKRKELENQLRMKHFEEEKRQQEKAKRAEAEQQARQAALERREEEQRSALRYGPKKAKIGAAPTSEGSPPKWPSSSSHIRAREDARKRRLPGVDDDNDDSAPEFLTREEKRERKQQLEMRKLFNPTKRSSNAGGYSKAGRRLPGGAVDVTTASQVPDASSSSKSVKERIAAMPNTLTKLNTVKRDTRTIDEILQDRAKLKEKVLDGDEAREFNDWFGTSKKKEIPRKQLTSAATSGANTPASQGGSSTPQPSSQGSVMKKSAPPPKSLSKPVPSKAAAPVSAAPKYSVPTPRTGTVDKHASLKATTPAAKPLKHSASSAISANARNAPSAKKRPRSISRSESPPPYKKRARSPDDNDIGNTIWKMFGRDRNAYVGMDVLSDDEDMEADATILEKEEKMSARIAKKEDVLALEEERRREEEKRRRKKEKEAREKRN